MLSWRHFLLITLCLSSWLDAQDMKDKPRLNLPVSSVDASVKLRRLTAKDTNAPSLSNFDAFSNIVVAPGQAATLTSTLDWTGADHVSIAIHCPAGTNLTSTVLAVQWAIPALASTAPYYTATDAILGQNLLLPNMGGGTVPVYGNQLQIVVVNGGSTAISCDQVTAYAVVH
jgi:hypothetical protein